LQDDEPSWHIFVDSIIFDTSHGLVEFFIAMMELNKYVLDPSFVSYIKFNLKDLFSFLSISLQVDGVGAHKT